MIEPGTVMICCSTLTLDMSAVIQPVDMEDVDTALVVTECLVLGVGLDKYLLSVIGLIKGDCSFTAVWVIWGADASDDLCSARRLEMCFPSEWMWTLVWAIEPERDFSSMGTLVADWLPGLSDLSWGLLGATRLMVGLEGTVGLLTRPVLNVILLPSAGSVRIGKIVSVGGFLLGLLSGVVFTGYGFTTVGAWGCTNERPVLGKFIFFSTVWL